MINKQSIWFTFLFSIILVLSIFYITMNDSKLDEYMQSEKVDDTTLVVNESTELVALRVQSDEETLETINNLQEIILSETSDFQSKNDAYNDLLTISNNKSDEEKIEKILKNKLQYDSFVKINGSNVTVVIDANEHDYVLANNVIKMVQENFDKEMYVTVKFN